MEDCECLAGCPFFHDKMESKPAMAELYKKEYCKGDSTECARCCKSDSTSIWQS